MLRRFYIFLFPIAVCLLPVSCKEVAGKKHLPIEQMQKIMLDINLAEAYSAMAKDSLHQKGTKNGDSLAAYYKVVFSHHGITQEQFRSSLAWYKSHPEDMDTLFNNMIPVVERWQGAKQ